MVKEPTELFPTKTFTEGSASISAT
jgi:hypothetical protein